MGGISKEMEGVGSVGLISHGCSNSSGNALEGVCDDGRRCGKLTLLSTGSEMEGGAVPSLALICHTERNRAYFLHVANASL